MSTSYPYSVGINNVGSYQASGVPWCSGSSTHANGTQIQYNFPSITRAITVTNNGANAIIVHFNSQSDGNVLGGKHFVALSGSMVSQRFEVKVDGKLPITASRQNLLRFHLQACINLQAQD
jgi:hypothetical protein